ncbi:hypothetical protein [Pseudomonas sp. COW5]|uniref:hypothetical protein n=1 Tax=Pseudomonas sp. COW5 TaxID=2981253 RepID=UPI0022457FCF|nr:hypothetical protein [Pseudomonas sp. COW5]MCX2545981.1 hypothetical protein [Pseudomonas sp. COW5]
MVDSEQAVFDLGKWHGALIFSSANFRDFKGYLENTDAVDFHLSAKKILSVNDDGDLIHRPLSDDPLSSAISDKYKESFSDSLTMHANMLVVMAGAYFENIVFDFLQNFFTHKPNSLHQYVGGEDRPGYIKVTEVFSYNALSDLMTELSARGAKNAAAGSPDIILRRIRTLTKHEIPSKLEQRLVKLVAQRNAIAHDIKQYSLDEIDIEGAYETLEEFLKTLGLITSALHLPLYDPGHLLT